jgi:hypothetical protein
VTVKVSPGEMMDIVLGYAGIRPFDESGGRIDRRLALLGQQWSSVSSFPDIVSIAHSVGLRVVSWTVPLDAYSSFNELRDSLKDEMEHNYIIRTFINSIWPRLPDRDGDLRQHRIFRYGERVTFMVLLRLLVVVVSGSDWRPSYRMWTFEYAYIAATSSVASRTALQQIIEFCVSQGPASEHNSPGDEGKDSDEQTPLLGAK